MDALLRRRVMMASGASPTPSGTPYIRGGGNGSYIDTGITSDSDTKIIVWARNFNVGTDVNWLFGARTSTPSYFELVAGRLGNAGKIGGYFGDSATWHTDAWPYFSHYHKYELSADGLFVDDTQLISAYSGTFTGSVNIHLFGYNANGVNSGSLLPADICACKIYKNGVLVRDFTAVNTPSVGLYDAVSDTVFTNAGSGSFAYGLFNENAYTPLEYITCSGAQYFDTGLKGGYSIPWVFVFTPTGTVKQTYYPTGARTSGSSNRCEVALGNATYTNGILYFCYKTEAKTVKSTTTNDYFTNKKIVYQKKDNVATAFVNSIEEGSVTGATGTTFLTDYNIFVGATNSAGSASGGFVGNLYHYGIGTDRNYVPSKVNNVAGMYDTYNDVFKPSASETAFIAGPEL